MARGRQEKTLRRDSNGGNKIGDLQTEKNDNKNVIKGFVLSTVQENGCLWGELCVQLGESKRQENELLNCLSNSDCRREIDKWFSCSF